MTDLGLPQEIHKGKAVNKLVMGAMVIIAVCFAVLLYWTLSGSDVLTVKNDPVPVTKTSPTPVADGEIIFRVDFCKNINAKGRVRTSFISPGREIFIPVYEDNLGKGCRNIDLPVIIPKELPPGEYHVHYRIEYRVNPLKSVVEEFNSQEFEVK